MFEKLLATLPYNPSLMHQMSFYSRRMRAEASVRRIGLVFIVLAFFLQFFAVMSPPQASVAASNSDLINGGFSSAADAARNCRDNVQHYRTILNYYGIECSDLANATTVTIHSTGTNFWSMGRIPQGPRDPNTGLKTGETPVTIAGVGQTLYWRYLKTYPSPDRKALKFTASKTGKTFFALYLCGNLVARDIPTKYVAPAPTPVTTTPTPIPTTPTPTPTVTTTPPCIYDNTILSTDVACVPCIYNNTITASNTACKPCEESLSSTDTTACVHVSKTASNTTQSISDANNTMAQVGDVIVYTLHADNTGKADVKAYTFEENLSDVLDYADATDLHGGTLSTDGIVQWPAVDLPAGQSVTKQITVTVSATHLSTPMSSSDSNHYDLHMTNVYGNTITINLPGPIVKVATQQTETTLVNTGPGTSMAIAGAIVVVAGYFFARSRLLSQESQLVLHETTQGGTV